MFSNIQVTDVETPIVIDQYYCDKSKCSNQTSAVAVSAIQYVNVKGTYTSEPVRFACSDNLPCSGLTLDTIKLEASKSPVAPFCWKAYGELKTTTEPPIDCLGTGNPSKSGAYSTDSCWVHQFEDGFYTKNYIYMVYTLVHNQCVKCFKKDDSMIVRNIVSCI